MNETTSQARVPSCPHCGSKEFFRSRRSGIKDWSLRHVLFQKAYRRATLQPFTIRCGAPDCDWGHKMYDLLGRRSVAALLFRVSQALLPETRSSGVGLHSFGPGKLVADAHQDIARLAFFGKSDANHTDGFGVKSSMWNSGLCARPPDVD